jgi:ribonuclease P/MRP protein subunit RPP40
LKFADDSKIFSSSYVALQSDLHNLFIWSVDWQMLFNIEKCVVIHMGSKNLNISYNLGGTVLKPVDQEKDLGVIIHKNGKKSEQCTIAANKANRMLGMIKRNIKYKSKNVIISLYKALVRPRLEYCVQAWCPNLAKDINLLEKVQRRATKMIDGFNKLSYERRLEETGLTTLVVRRARGDLIETFKILKGFDNIDYKIFFTLAEDLRIRGHSLKIVKNRCNTIVRSSFFSQRCVNLWNGLPENVIQAESVNTFKNRLDKIKFM